MKYNYSILQLKDEIVGKTFFDYDYIIEKYGEVNIDDYETVYEGEIESIDEENALEDLFTIFNIRHPEDFRGHSLSVSDIVKLNDKYHYCDSLGWKKLSSEVIKEDYSILTLDLLIEKLTSLRDFYKCGSHVVKFTGKNDEGNNITKNFTADNFYDLPKSNIFMIDTL